MRKTTRTPCAMPVQQINVNPVEYSKDVEHSMDEGAEWREAILALSGGNPVPPERCMSQASTLSNSYDICRICHCEGERDAPLIAPCYCSGSLRYVHQACLQQWIKSSDIRACELCKFQFVMYSKIKPIMQWEHLELTPLERRKLLCMVLFHSAALSCVLWSLHVLIDGTLEEINKGLLEWSLWTKLIGVTAVFSGGVAYIFHQGKAYCALCRRWRAFNRVIYVQNAPEKIALDARQNVTIHQSQRPEGTLLTSGGCCGVETESAVADMRENPHEHNASIDLHPDPATSTSHSSKSDASLCKQDILQDKRMWFRSSSAYGSKDNLGACSKSGSLSNDDISITSFDELAHSCLRSSRNSINEDMEPLPPPAAFVDSATNTELVYENEKEGKLLTKTASISSDSPVPAPETLSKSCSSSRASLSKCSDHSNHPSQSFTQQSTDPSQENSSAESKVNSSLMLGSGLTYSRPTRVGYPYLLSTFHPMIPQNLNVQSEDRSGSSSSSGSEECVASLMRQPHNSHDSTSSKTQQTRPWTVGGPYFLQSTSYQPDDGWLHTAEDIRSDRSGIRPATSSSESSSRFQCPSGSQSPLLSAAKSHPLSK